MTPAERKIVEELIKVTGLLARQQRKPRYRDMLNRAVAAAQAVLDGAALAQAEPASFEGAKINKPAADPLAQLRAALSACEAAGLPGHLVAGEVYHGFRLSTLMDQEPAR